MRIGNLPIPLGIYFEQQPFVLLCQQDSSEISSGLRTDCSFGRFFLTWLGRHRSRKLSSVDGTTFSSFVPVGEFLVSWCLSGAIFNLLFIESQADKWQKAGEFRGTCSVGRSWWQH